MLLGGRRNISEIWRNAAECLRRSHVGDMENRGGVVMAISYWSSLRISLELDDHKWRLNRNGEIMEINYGDQTLFIMEWRIHIWSILRIETYKVLDVP